MHLEKALTLFFIVFMMPGISWSESNTDNLLSSYRITAGITVNSIDFDVYNKDSSNPNGTLSEDFSFYPFIILSSPYKFFAESNWGGLMEYSLSGFQLNQQYTNDNLIDLGTSVKGYYIFATPTLLYSFNGQSLHGNLKPAITAGLGIGIGYLSATGDMIFTESTQERFPIDINGAALAVSLFVDYRTGDFITRISGGLTSHSKNKYEYDAFGFSLDFGYIF